MNALVLGAAGFLGINLVDALRAAGVDPLCGRRRRTNVLPLRSRKTRLVEADLDEPASLRAALRDVDVVFHLAGHYPRHSLDRATTLQTGLRQLDHVLDAAASAGTKRVVYVSSTATVAPRGPSRAPAPHREPSDESDVYGEAPGHGVYHDLKWHMERRALTERRVDVRVACPGACLGAWDLRVGTSALLVAAARHADPPHPDGAVALVDATDVARGLIRLGADPSPPRRVLFSGGTHGLHALLVGLADRYRGPAPSPPLSAAEALAFADAEERRAVREGGRAALSREIADLVVHGVPIDAGLSTRALGLTYTPLSATLDRFDDWARRLRIIPPMETTT